MCQQTYEVCIRCGHQYFGLLISCGQSCGKLDIRPVNVLSCEKCAGGGGGGGGGSGFTCTHPPPPRDARVFHAHPE